MIKLEKRDGTYEVFDKNKIINAIYKSTINSKYGIDKNLGKKIADNIEKMVNENKINLTVEDIQDNVEVLLMESNRKDVAKNYILYREKRSDIRKSKWQMDELQKSIWANKYQYNNETFNEWIERVSGGNKKRECRHAYSRLHTLSAACRRHCSIYGRRCDAYKLGSGDCKKHKKQF